MNVICLDSVGGEENHWIKLPDGQRTLGPDVTLKCQLCVGLTGEGHQGSQLYHGQSGDSTGPDHSTAKCRQADGGELLILSLKKIINSNYLLKSLRRLQRYSCAYPQEVSGSNVGYKDQ